MHRVPAVTRVAAVTGLTAGLLVLPGCLVTHSSSVRESGTRVSGASLAQVECGKTTEAWVRASFGEPSGVEQVGEEEGHRVLRYDYVQRTHSSGTVFLLFAGSSDQRQSESTYFEVRDGVVVRSWKDLEKS